MARRILEGPLLPQNELNLKTLAHLRPLNLVYPLHPRSALVQKLANPAGFAEEKCRRNIIPDKISSVKGKIGRLRHFPMLYF
jgi:hypothetical protein